MQGAYTIPTAPRLHAADFVIDSYLLHIKTQQCSCGNIEKSSELFEVWVNPRAVAAHGDRQLRPLKGELRKDLEIAYSILAPRRVPVCHSCVGQHSIVPGENKPPISRDEWEATLRRKYAGTQSPALRSATRMAEARTEPRAKKVTLEDL